MAREVAVSKPKAATANEGTTKVKPRKALLRRRAHFGCAACDRGDYKNCPERDRCGDPNERTVLVKTQNALSSAHMKQNRAMIHSRGLPNRGITSRWNLGRVAAMPGVLPYDPDEHLFSITPTLSWAKSKSLCTNVLGTRRLRRSGIKSLVIKC